MATQEQQRLLFEHRELQRRASFSQTVGPITDVDKGYVRVQVGNGPNGPVKTPWFIPTSHMGQHAQQYPWKPGMNMKVSSSGGDLRMANGTHWAQNDEHKEPAHADEAGDKAFTTQNGPVFTTTEAEDGVHEVFIGKEQQQQSGQQGQSSSAGGASGGSGTGAGSGGDITAPYKAPQGAGDAEMLLRVNKAKGITMMHKKGDTFTTVTEKVAALTLGKKGDKAALWCDKKDEQEYSTKPMRVKKFPDECDDKRVTGKKREKQSRQSGQSGGAQSSGG